MNYSSLLTKLTIFSLLLASVPLTLVAGNSSDLVQSTSTLDAVNKDWTVLIYMCGDNNLEAFAFDDLNELEAAGGTTADVNVVVMVDQSSIDYPDPAYVSAWDETRYYIIEGDGLTSTFTSPLMLLLENLTWVIVPL